MTKRQIVVDAITFKRPAYVPWQIGLTVNCAQRLKEHAGSGFDLGGWLDEHFVWVGQGGVRETWLADDGRFVKDVYGVTWDRTIDPDIGTPCDWPIKEASDLDRYEFPDADQDSWYAGCRQ